MTRAFPLTTRGSYDLEKWVHSDVPFREYSFLNSTRVTAADRADVVRLGVKGASDMRADAPGERTLLLEPGDTYADAASKLKASAHPSPFVVDVSARSLELLCEDLGSGRENGAFNQIMHTVLGVAEQVRYCDLVENPTYGRGAQAYDEWTNPINCTWGFHRPPKLPEDDAARAETCKRSVEAILRERWKEQERHFDNPFFGGFQAKRRQAWSTRDRPAYLHHNIIK